MSTATPENATELDRTPEQHRDRGAQRRHGARRGRRRAVLTGGTAVVLAAIGGGATWAAGAFLVGSHPSSGVADNVYPTGLATVTLGSMSSQQQVSATLGYAGSYSVLNQAAGVYTQLPAPGRSPAAARCCTGSAGIPSCCCTGVSPPTGRCRRG